MTVALIDYGAGNLHSVANALKAAGCGTVKVTADPMVVRAADRIVLPGVGSFRACAEGLRAIPGLIETMTERVQVGAAPLVPPTTEPMPEVARIPVGWLLEPLP